MESGANSKRDRADDAVFCSRLFSSRKVGKDARILELGAWKSSFLQELHKHGYANLYGMDSNRNIYDMPEYTKIRYVYGREQRTHFPNNFFEVVRINIARGSSVSIKALLDESKRILRPEGLLIIKSPNIAQVSEAMDTESWSAIQKSDDLRVVVLTNRKKPSFSNSRRSLVMTVLRFGMPLSCSITTCLKRFGISFASFTNMASIPYSFFNLFTIVLA